MDINEKFQNLLRKFNLGKFDEVIFESTLMAKKYPNQEVFINLLSTLIRVPNSGSFLSAGGSGMTDKSLNT